MTRHMAKQLDEEIERYEATAQPINLPSEYVERVAKTWKEEVSICRREGRRYFSSQYLELRYEDLHVDPEATLSEVLQFLGANRSTQIIKHCLSQASFSKLAKGRKPGEEDPYSFLRKGIVGDWRSVFQNQHVELFNGLAGDRVMELRYSL